MAKAIALLSGGLDSLLSVIVTLRQGIEVTAITFLTTFGCNFTDSSSCSSDSSHVANQFGFQLKLCHLGDKFIDIVKNPEYGYGKNMNPCVDCRILMLKEAKAFMEMTGADFIVTGEVLGQRPMSQRRDNFPVIDKKAGVQRLVLRPLTAKLLEPTMPELNGIVDRGKLYAFNGRSRKPQIALAKELGLTQYPSPGGGCLLTDVGTSNKLRELFQKNQRPDNRDIKLINVGRHFRISPTTKIIIGRDEADNAKLNALILPTDYLFNVDHYGSPLALINGEATEENIKLAASLCARYSSARTLPLVEVSAYQGRFDEGNLRYKLTVEPAKDSFIQKALLT